MAKGGGMRITHCLTLIVLLTLIGAAPAPTPAPPAAPPTLAPGGVTIPVGNELPAIEQLKSQLATQPQEVLKSASKLLALKGDAAKAYDRYELLSLRGEAALRTKANTMAVEAFAAAGKETNDEQKKA